MTDLESETDALDAACAEMLGETITYVRAGRAPLRFKADVDYADGIIPLGAGQMVEQEMAVIIRKLALPFEPGSNDRIFLPRRPGMAYRPGTTKTDSSGTHWVIVPKLVK